MKKTLLALGILTLLVTYSSAQSTSFKEKLKSKTAKTESNSFDKAIVFRPGYAANYYWDQANSIWSFQDTSNFSYNSQGYETVNLRTNSGVINMKSTKTYDASYRVTEELNQYYDNVNSVFVNSSRSTNSYDANGAELEYKYENWNTSTNLWVMSYGRKHIRTYDANNNEVEYISQEYNLNLFVYENSFKYIYTYDASNNIVSQEYIEWDGTAWVKESIDTYHFTNGILTSFEYKTWDGTAYVNSFRYTDLIWINWTNIDDSQIASYTIQEWNGTTWVTTSRSSNTYDANGGSVELSEDYVAGVWIISSRYSVFYDANLNYTGSRSENWENNVWVIDYEYKEIFTYDVNQNTSQKITQNWNNQTLVLENQSRRDYGNYTSYSNSVSLFELNELVAINIYPNPVKDKCNVEISTKNLSSNARFILLDITGKEVFNMEAKEQFSFESEQLNSGFYTYQIQDNSAVKASGKIILE